MIYIIEKSITDWKNIGFSNLNLKHVDIRKSIGNKELWLDHISYNKKNNNLTLDFYAKPTFINKISPYDNKIQKSVEIITTDGNKTSSKYRPYYNIKIQFTNILSIKKQWKDKSYDEKYNLIEDMIKNWYEVKIWSNDLSFLYQGTWKILDDLDSSIYPFPDFPDSGQWKKLHGNSGIHLTKHLYFVLQIIDRYIDNIISILNAKLGIKYHIIITSDLIFYII